MGRPIGKEGGHLRNRDFIRSNMLDVLKTSKPYAYRKKSLSTIVIYITLNESMPINEKKKTNITFKLSSILQLKLL